MPDEDDFYASPGEQFEPGDIFIRLPFVSLKYPLRYWRAQGNDPNKATLCDLEHGEPRPNQDTPKSSLEHRSMMLLSHGCEIDRVLKKEDPRRRVFLAAPVLPLAECNPETQTRTREGNQPNRFYLRPSQYTGESELCVDFRKITPIIAQYFIDSDRTCSLSENARKFLFSKLGVFFSGYALYLGPIECPVCETPFDVSQFLVPSGDEPDNE